MRKILPILASIATFRPPFQARIAHAVGVSAASLAAVDALADQGIADAAAAQAAADTAQTDVNAITPALRTSVGVKLERAPYLVDATGSAVLVPLTGGLPLASMTTGKRIGITGTITARTTAGAHIQSKRVNSILVVDATDPQAITVALEHNEHALNIANAAGAGFSDYFANNDAVADFDTACVAVTGELQLVTTPTTETTSDFHLEADLVIVDLGAPTVI